MSLLSKDRIIAPPGFNRWLVPPAALAIHLSIGMAYGFSVFWLPLSRAVGITQSTACPADWGFFQRLVATTCDWKISTLGVMYSLFFLFLGASAAIFGRWVEREGPRKAAVVAALCWGGGLLISALGVFLHQILLLWIGSGVIGGCGLGLGYISPVSTLIKWFPDRRGMATGMAIMGFGGGAMIGSPMADILMRHFATASAVGAWQTFVTLGLVYSVAMLCGAFGYRLPPPGWRPAGWTPVVRQGAMITACSVDARTAPRTPQFWLLFTVLCMNVSAGIGIIGMASPMLQEVFGGKLIGVAGALKDLLPDQRARVATIGAGFAALLSLFNIVGRIGWASFSDLLGRKRTYVVFFAAGIVLYALAPSAGHAGSVSLFVGIFCLIITMYGGGFATIPAYIADLFGTRFVGAIHGMILLAWSAAGILGPQLVNNIREYQIGRGVPPASAYDTAVYVLVGLLVVGFIANLSVTAVAERFYLTEAQPGPPSERAGGGAALPAPTQRWVSVAVAWALVGIPLAWGIWRTLRSAVLLFS
jgi:MFS family permease